MVNSMSLPLQDVRRSYVIPHKRADIFLLPLAWSSTLRLSPPPPEADR